MSRKWNDSRLEMSFWMLFCRKPPRSDKLFRILRFFREKKAPRQSERANFVPGIDNQSDGKSGNRKRIFSFQVINEKGDEMIISR